MHSVVWAPIVGPPTTQIPFIVKEGGTLSFEFYRFIGAPRYYSRSQSWRATAARGVALLLDLEEGLGISSSQGRALDELRSGLLNGLKIEFGPPRPDLLWEPQKPAYAEQLYVVARQFDNYRTGRSDSGTFTSAAARDASIFRHLKPAPSTGNSYSTTNKAVAAPFPLQYISDFFSALEEGSASPRHALRDRLYFILLAFAGMRRSEPLHLWTHDVEIAETGLADVYFYHPDYGPTQPNRRNSETRRVTLQKKYHRIPRNLLGKTDPVHAGWKGMLFDEQQPGGDRTRAYWLEERAAFEFARLHAEYASYLRPQIRQHHPYYFTLLTGENAGYPLTIQSIQAVFERTVRTLGLPPNTTMHSFRHAYARRLVSAGLSPNVVQVCLHHRSAASQGVYTRPGPEEVTQALNEAAQRKDGPASGRSLSTMRWRSDPLGLFPGPDQSPKALF